MHLGSPVQIAYAVPDVESAARSWAAHFGAGPFFVRAHIELVDVVIRGRPGTFDHSSAYGQWGAVMVELVEDHGDGPSPVRDMFPRDGSGLHHLAFFVENVDAAVEDLMAQGHELAMSARTASGLVFCFVDTRRHARPHGRTVRTDAGAAGVLLDGARRGRGLGRGRSRADRCDRQYVRRCGGAVSSTTTASCHGGCTACGRTSIRPRCRRPRRDSPLRTTAWACARHG